MTSDGSLVGSGIPASAAPRQRVADSATADPRDELAALLGAVIEVPPPRMSIRQRRPVISVEAAPGPAGQAPPSRADLRASAYRAAHEALSQLRARAAEPGGEQLTTVRSLLTAATATWRAPARGPAGVFPTFSAVCRAMDLDLASVSEDARAQAIRGQLLGGRPHAFKEILQGLGAGLGLIGTLLSISQAAWAAAFATWLTAVGYLGLGVAVAYAVAFGVTRLRALLRLTRVWRADGRAGWTMWSHATEWHPALVDGASRDTGGASVADRLLVRAVLLDLRRAYRRPLRLGAWPARYPVLLLPAGPTAGPVDTLRSVHLDTPCSPLVLVTAGAGEPLPDGRPAAAPASWLTRLDGQPLDGRHPRLAEDEDPVWRVSVPPQTHPPAMPGSPGPVPLRGPRWWESRYVHWTAAAAPLLLVAGFLVLDRPGPDCTDDQQSWKVLDGQQIGYRLCGAPFADSGNGAVAIRLRTFQNDIFGENRRADRIAGDTRRQVLTLVAITALTTTDDDTSVMAEAEGLAGVYAAQHAINSDPGDHPLLKIAVANAGANGDHLDELLTNHLVKSLFADAKVDRSHALGATITVNSTRTVKKALGELKDKPVTLITPTMTADGIGKNVPGFYQMITPNAQQGKLVVEYVRKVYPGRRLIDVHPQPKDPQAARNDLYVESLAQGLAAEARVPKKGKKVEFHEEPWSGDGNFRGYCTARHDVVLFYGGRYPDFGDFLQKLSIDCPQNRPPVIADDSSARLLSDRIGVQGVPADIPVVMATKSIPLYCAMLSLNNFANPPRAEFRDDMRAALDRCDPHQSSQIDDAAGLAGGWAASSYDAIRVLYWALSPALRPRQTPQQVAAEAAQRLHHAAIPFGVNSPIAFNADNVAENWRISLYCLPDPSAAFANKIGEVMRDGIFYPVDGPKPPPSRCRQPAA